MDFLDTDKKKVLIFAGLALMVLFVFVKKRSSSSAIAPAATTQATDSAAYDIQNLQGQIDQLQMQQSASGAYGAATFGSYDGNPTANSSPTPTSISTAPSPIVITVQSPQPSLTPASTPNGLSQSRVQSAGGVSAPHTAVPPVVPHQTVAAMPIVATPTLVSTPSPLQVHESLSAIPMFTPTPQNFVPVPNVSPVAVATAHSTQVQAQASIHNVVTPTVALHNTVHDVGAATLQVHQSAPASPRTNQKRSTPRARNGARAM